MARKTLTDNGVAALKAKAARYAFADPELRGHVIRVTPTGSKSYVVVARDPAGRQVWHTVSSADVMGIEEARQAARSAILRIRAGLPAVEVKAAVATFRTVADGYFKRHVEARGLRTAYEMKRVINVYVMPSWADRAFVSIRRSEVADLLDRIEDDNGASQADAVLSVLRTLFGWYQRRDDSYVSPVVSGMRRRETKANARDRILSDDELRLVWEAAGRSGSYGAMIKLALLTAQRREKLSSLKWSDINDGVWTVASEDREKNTGGALKLPAMALDIIKAQHRVGDNPHVFAGRGSGGAFISHVRSKADFDRTCPLETPFVFHDLRRTARSLMSRAGVTPHVSERVMGHSLPGVEATYDRHGYDSEKAAALAKLASLLQSIIDPQPNVVPMVRK